MKNLELNFQDAALYVACLESYNEGTLHGSWLKLADYANASDFLNAVSSVIIGEEYAIHDFEFIPPALYSEFMPESRIQEVYDFFEHLEDVEKQGLKEPFLMYCESNNTTGLKEDFERFEDVYLGHYDGGLVEYAEELLSDSVPDFLINFVDYEKYARELGYEGYYEQDGYIFR